MSLYVKFLLIDLASIVYNFLC